MANVLVGTSTFPADVPPRSHFYCRAPLGLGTPLIESLSSYINRLAWTYRINTRVLIAQEVIPRLKGSYHIQTASDQHGGFGRSRAMRINGAGEVALDWAETLELLTMRSNLRELTAHFWVDSPPTHGLLRAFPRWCPICYYEWREQGLPIYQPLIWMFQAVTICLQHNCQLEERCFQCQKHQSVLGVLTQPGHCTLCSSWLGAPYETMIKNKTDVAILEWQQWVVNVFEELRVAKATSGSLHWEELVAGLKSYVEALGSARQLARLGGLSKNLPTFWINHKQTPSFDKILAFCYALNTSPYQLMLANHSSPEKFILSQSAGRIIPCSSLTKQPLTHGLRNET